MKFNKWTVGLAAVGAISAASVAQAEEHAVATALASTTISGYVDTSVNWTLDGQANGAANHAFSDSGTKANGFNLNVVKLTLEKPLDESDWAAGYRVDLLFGPDANGWNPTTGGGLAAGAGTGDFAIKQAYVEARIPVGGTGINVKLGSFDTIVGYEVFESGSNPNFTRSYGFAIEPTQHTGILASYQVADYLSVAAGVANTLTPGINTQSTIPVNAWRKTALASATLTAPDDMGFLAGSALYAGMVYGFAGGTEDSGNYYLGAVMNTPVTGLTAGLAYDYVDNCQFPLFSGPAGQSVAAYAMYLSYQATEKLSLHGRADYYDGETAMVGGKMETVEAIGLTGTVQYDLWANLLSRVELRWDHSLGKPDLFGSPDTVSMFANFIYQF